MQHDFVPETLKNTYLLVYKLRVEASVTRSFGKRKENIGIAIVEPHVHTKSLVSLHPGNKNKKMQLTLTGHTKPTSAHRRDN